MTAIDDAVSIFVGDIVATARDSSSALVDAITASVQADDAAALAAAQAQLGQAQAALAAETALETQDEQEIADRDAKIAALNATIAQLEAVIASGAGFMPAQGQRVMGASSDTGNPSMLVSQFGLTSLAQFRYYRQATDSDASVASMASLCAASNTLLVLSTKIPNNDHAGLAAGKYDAFLKGRCDALSSGGVNTVLIVHHEPENDITATGTMTTKAFADGQAHVAEFLKAYPTIAFSNAAMGSWYSTWSTGKKGDFKAMYPDPSIYDVFGFDRYEESYAGHEAHHTVDQLVGDVVRVFRSNGVTQPLALWEHGVRVDPTIPGYAANWLKDLYAALLALDIRFASYFFSGKNSPNGPWYWTDKTDERQAVLGGFLGNSPRVVLTKG